MSETPPVVSVVVPVFRSERFVAATIRSVLAQTLRTFELIVVDDGSPDRSIEICRTFADPRIRYVHQPNRGLAAARNAGIRHARGRYIALLDSDDLWAPEKLAHQVAHLESLPEVGVSFGYSMFIDENGDRLGGYQMLGKELTRAADCFVANPIGNGSNAMLRAEVFTEERWRDGVRPAAWGCLFDEELRQAEDFELWLRIALLTRWRIACTPWVLTLYRVHPSSLSADVSAQSRFHRRAIEKVAAYAPRLVTRYRATGESNMFWYFARNHLLQGKLSDARRMVVRALGRKPANVSVYQALILVYLALCSVLPAGSHPGLLRWGQRVYGRYQERVIRRRQQRAMGITRQ
ncbi:MAG: glycosyltransferase [Betaproteobacteria bacterium]